MEDLGKRMRAIRKVKNLTLKDVAHMTNLTESLISQIENTKANPSVASLVAISRALGVPIGAFFDDHGASVSPVIRRNERPVVHTANGITYFLLNHCTAECPIEALWVEYEPGSSTGEPFSHAGTECGVVMSGKLEVQSHGKTFVLNSGDSITLASTEPHKVSNLADGISTAMWVNSPPIF